MPRRNSTHASPIVAKGGGATVRLSLLLVDDHTVVRKGLRALLELESDFNVVGEAGSFEEAVDCVVRLRPDVVITDIGLPGRSGLLLVRELRAVAPTVRILLLTAHASLEYIRAGLDARPDGYLVKDASHAELLLAIRTIATGQRYLCAAAAVPLLKSFSRGGDQSARQDPLELITARERQVLVLLAAGHSNKIAARMLNVSAKTIEKHRGNFMRKLALHNAADIARFALGQRLIDDGDRYFLGDDVRAESKDPLTPNLVARPLVG